MIQIQPSESSSAGSTMLVTGSRRELSDLRAAFERDHLVRLPRLLSGALLERVQEEVEQAEFQVREHKGISTELWISDGAAPALMLFLTNDPNLFELVRAITGCGRIGLFDGRVYRMMPGPEHADSWHRDISEGRIVAMSINLSAADYSGGILELREDSGTAVRRAANTGPGDAVLFRIGPRLAHRVTAVEGDVPRTAYAGWFTSGPDSALVRPRAAGGGGPARAEPAAL